MIEAESRSETTFRLQPDLSHRAPFPQPAFSAVGSGHRPQAEEDPPKAVTLAEETKSDRTLAAEAIQYDRTIRGSLPISWPMICMTAPQSAS